MAETLEAFVVNAALYRLDTPELAAFAGRSRTASGC
jgi:hypothetical protein